MSQLPETTSNNPPPPTQSPNKHNLPLQSRSCQWDPYNAITHEHQQRLLVLSERLSHQITEMSEKLDIVVTTVENFFRPGQQIQAVTSALETTELYSACIDDLKEMLEILHEYARYGHAGMELVVAYARLVGELAKALNVSVKTAKELTKLLTVKAEFWQERNQSAVELVGRLEDDIQDATSGI